jgi:hypothetical protein
MERTSGFWRRWAAGGAGSITGMQSQLQAARGGACRWWHGEAEQRCRAEHGAALGLARRNEVGFLLWGHDSERISQRTRGQSKIRGSGGLGLNWGHGWLWPGALVQES